MMNRKIDEELRTYAEVLDKNIVEIQQKKQQLETKLEQYEREFRKGKLLGESGKRMKKNVSSLLRAIPAYLLGRRNPKKLYSRAYKQKDASNQLKKYKSYLYNLGFEDKALKDLQDIFHTTTNHYLRKAAAWELAFWFANKLSKEAAKYTLFYLQIALEKERNRETLRKGSILQAEAFELLGNKAEGKKVIQQELKNEEHPDLYLALANLETTTEGRVHAINKAFDMYHLAPIKLEGNAGKSLYEQLSADQPEKNRTTGPKVTVIIPAYNAEKGINIAIESIQQQTYTNLEIIVVDDCSTDRTPEVIKQYAERDARVKFLSTPENSGPYIARNIALEHATGEFVTINDADDWSHPEKIAIQVKDLIDNPHRIANTSEHARVTEELKLYRRGMPGQYIFSNMSSLMFRRNPVLEKVGYWDSVRFAADSEFKKRLIKVFGLDKVTDLKTGPLSLPMQSSGSLTGSSAFGYNGHLKGVRKEYAESQAFFHAKATSLYMPYPQTERRFPVPEPMWPQRETKKNGIREFDFVIVADYRKEIQPHIAFFIEQEKEAEKSIGLVQMGTYDLKVKPQIHSSVREIIDGSTVQMLVYGEKIQCGVLLVSHPGIFQEEQSYVPEMTARTIHVIIPHTPNGGKIRYQLRACARAIESFGKTTSTWYPLTNEIRTNLLENHLREVRSIRLSKENWLTDNKEAIKTYVNDWFPKQNPYKL